MSEVQKETPAPEYVDAYPEATGKVETLLGRVRETLVSMTDACKEMATVIVDIRAGIEREVTSKKSGKTVTVPDWDGRSDEYRSWNSFIFRPMLEKLIPSEEQNKLMQRIQNHVQAEFRAKGRATDSQLAHLGIDRKTKSQRQSEQRNGDKAAANGSRASEERFDVDSLVAFVKEMPDPKNADATLSRPVRDAAAGIVAMAHALEDRTSAAAFEISTAERKATDAYIVQALTHLVRVRLHIGAVDSVEDALAEVNASVEVAA